MTDRNIVERVTLPDEGLRSQPSGKLTEEDLAAWRLAAPGDLASADERNLENSFPFGWFAVAYSDEVAAGEVVPVRYFGRELALWRDEDGAPGLLDAYCAHYGAHMGHGGRVVNGSLECPFHAWRYDKTGAVVDIPYARTIPPQARRKDCVPSWPVREANGFIWMWYHPDRTAPQWAPVTIPEVGDPAWSSFAKFEWKVFTSLENMADNGVDIAHFKFVHGSPSVPDYKISFDGIRRSVLALIELQTPKGIIKGSIDSVNHGPGQGWVKFLGLSETLLVTAVTPIDRDLLKVRFAFTQPLAEQNGSSAGLGRALIRDICKQLDQDKLILDRHRRMAPPLICDGDGPFGRNRDYYSQFYTTRGPAQVASAT